MVTLVFWFVKATVQVLGPADVTVPVFVQLEDNPQKAPALAGAVKVTVAPAR
jgi:hypothetical protein